MQLDPKVTYMACSLNLIRPNHKLGPNSCDEAAVSIRQTSCAVVGRLKYSDFTRNDRRYRQVTSYADGLGPAVLKCVSRRPGSHRISLKLYRYPWGL